MAAKPFNLAKYKQLCNITTKCLHIAHGKYVNEVMGGSTPESLETGPDNAVCNGIKRAWLYLKLLQTESQGISALVSNNHICTLFRQLQSWGLTRAIWWHVHGRRPQEFTTKAPPSSPPCLMCMPGITFSTEGSKKKVLKIKVTKASGPCSFDSS